MFKALAKLTGPKSSPLTDEQLTKLQDVRESRDQWHADVAKLRIILTDLQDVYKKHKGDFAPARYEQLKDMIKGSVQRSTVIFDENKNHRTAAGCQRRGSAGKDSTVGASNRLKDSAAQFSKYQEQRSVSGGERATNGKTMTSKELEKELAKHHHDIVELKHEFRTLRDSLEVLARQYQESKRLNPAQRYVALREMIKDSTLVLERTGKVT